MKQKKILALITAFSVVMLLSTLFVLTGCGNEKVSPVVTSGTAITTESPAATYTTNAADTEKAVTAINTESKTDNTTVVIRTTDESTTSVITEKTDKASSDAVTTITASTARTTVSVTTAKTTVSYTTAATTSAETEQGTTTTALTYEQYSALSGDQQYEYYKTFASVDDFFVWYNAAKAAYDAAQSTIGVGSGDVIDLGDLSKKNSGN